MSISFLPFTVYDSLRDFVHAGRPEHSVRSGHATRGAHSPVQDDADRCPQLCRDARTACKQLLGQRSDAGERSCDLRFKAHS